MSTILLYFFLCVAASEAKNRQTHRRSKFLFGLSKIKLVIKAYESPTELKDTNTKLKIFSLTDVDVVFIIILIYLITTRK